MGSSQGPASSGFEAWTTLSHVQHPWQSLPLRTGLLTVLSAQCQPQCPQDLGQERGALWGGGGHSPSVCTHPMPGPGAPQAIVPARCPGDYICLMLIGLGLSLAEGTRASGERWGGA